LIKGNIYFVEDDRAISDDVSYLLQSNGYSVSLFSSGEEFLDALGSNTATRTVTAGG
jgi:FixJ family two-component response regulator